MGEENSKKTNFNNKENIEEEPNIEQEQCNKNIEDIYKIIQKYSKSLNSNSLNTLNSNTDENIDLNNVVNTMKNINLLKEELAKLQLSPEEKVYYEMKVAPLVLLLQNLGSSSYSFSFSAENLSNISSSRNSKIKDVINLVYNINDVSEDVLKILKQKIEIFLEISRKDK